MMPKKSWIKALEGPALIGMVHLLPLPGSPGWRGHREEVISRALRDAETLIKGGCDGIIVENMHDLPYLKGRVEPEAIALTAIIVHQIVEMGKPVGIQLLAGANREALGVAVSSGATFIRAEAFAYAHIADEGLLEASAAVLTRARRALGTHIEFWADIQKKHAAHAITSDLDIGELAKGNAFNGADVLIVTGKHTGQAAVLEDVRRAKAGGLPLAIGSGIKPDQMDLWIPWVDAFIVGSWLKLRGDWRNPVSLERCIELRVALDRAWDRYCTDGSAPIDP